MKSTKKLFYKIKRIPAMLGIGALTALPVACDKEKTMEIEKDPEIITLHDTVYVPRSDTVYVPKSDTITTIWFDTITQKPNTDVIITFIRPRDDETFDEIPKYVACDTISNIYLVPIVSDYWQYCNCADVHEIRYELQPILDLSPKIHGRGNFNFMRNAAAQRPEDSLWYVANGWTINKDLQR